MAGHPTEENKSEVFGSVGPLGCFGRSDAVASRFEGIEVKQRCAMLPCLAKAFRRYFLSTICVCVGDCGRGGKDAEAKRCIHRGGTLFVLARRPDWSGPGRQTEARDGWGKQAREA